MNVSDKRKIELQLLLLKVY